MEFKPTLIVITAICFVAAVKCDFEVGYVGDDVFKIGNDALFICEITPKLENVEGVVVSWSKTKPDGSPETIVKGKLFDPPTYYQSDPEDLRNRFSMSNSDLNSTGRVTATLSNVTIDDAGKYMCDVDDQNGYSQSSTPFAFTVYQLPTVEIEVLQPEINLLPNNYLNSEENSNTTENNETMVDTAPVDPSWEIARCSVRNSYPSPRMIIFEASTGEEWPFNEYETIENEDGTIDVSISLSLEPSPSLNGVSLTCKALVTEEQRSSESSSSESITVYYPTSFVEITVRPVEVVNEGDFVTVRCNSDGNPAPQKFIVVPGDQKIKLSGNAYAFAADSSSIGSYYCIAEDSSSPTPFISDNIFLDVNSLWSVDINGPTTLVDGDSTLTCSSEGRGPASYAWQKIDKDEIISRNSYLRLDHNDVEVSGTYICSVTRGGKTMSAQHTTIVQNSCKPTMDVLISSSPIKQGESFVIVSCIASGNPPCQMTMTGYKDIQPEISENKATLTVEAFPVQMQPYIVNCTATNAIGSESESRDLNHQDLCCVQPSVGGLSGGVVVLIIIIVAFIVIGAPLACFLLKPSGSSSGKGKKDNIDDVEKDRLNADADN